ncbi:MAG TPA: YHYH protein [Candidatus Obscuribacterales bacterium]
MTHLLVFLAVFLCALRADAHSGQTAHVHHSRTTKQNSNRARTSSANPWDILRSMRSFCPANDAVKWAACHRDESARTQEARWEALRAMHQIAQAPSGMHGQENHRDDAKGRAASRNGVRNNSATGGKSAPPPNSRTVQASAPMRRHHNFVSSGAHHHHQEMQLASDHHHDGQMFDPWALLNLALAPAHAAGTNVNISFDGPYRVIRSTGLPNHATGEFPNAGNPNTISAQDYVFKVPRIPSMTGYTIPLGMDRFGVAVNGIPLDPGAAEWWHNDPFSGWQYEAMHLGPRLGIDRNNAHVQPNGAYHYHGVPTGLLERLSAYNRPVLIGYAADGFPIYGPRHYSNANDPKSALKELKASYRVKQGTRRGGPGGAYDGSFVQDYEYVAGLGDLDDCNGRFGTTPEYPMGTYYYVLTQSYPYVPRGFKGIPDESFRKGPGGSAPPGGFPGRGAGYRTQSSPGAGSWPGPSHGQSGPGFPPPGGPGAGSWAGPSHGQSGPGFPPPGGPGFSPHGQDFNPGAAPPGASGATRNRKLWGSSEE